jgi:hypothetical protein
VCSVLEELRLAKDGQRRAEIESEVAKVSLFTILLSFIAILLLYYCLLLLLSYYFSVFLS